MATSKISVVTITVRPEGLKRVQESLVNQSFKDFEWIVEVGLGLETDINKALNKCIRRAKGELVVFVQDWISIPSTGLQQFWDAYQENPETFYTAPVGQKHEKEIKWDWRVSRLRNWSCDFTKWEIDYASAPLSALKEIGGFDEELDRYWGFDNVNAGLRATMAGYKIDYLEENKAVAIPHPDAPTKHLRNPQFSNRRLEEIKKGLIINYL